MAKILYAQPIIDSKIENLTHRTQELINKGKTPFMKVILVGNSPASLSYIKNKRKMCEKVGAKFELAHLPEDVTLEVFQKEVDDINNNPNITGGFIQLPLGEKLKNINTADLVAPQKDVDGFHPQNLYNILNPAPHSNKLIPCTPKGIMELCRFYDIDLEGKKVVILGRSLIVGKPLALLMTKANATVTLCHHKSKNIEEECKTADIIAVAIGKAQHIDKKFINPERNQIIIDVGINKKEGKLCGDVNLRDVEDVVSAITPVPKGVGPLTVISLIENLLVATENQL